MKIEGLKKEMMLADVPEGGCFWWKEEVCMRFDNGVLVHEKDSWPGPVFNAVRLVDGRLLSIGWLTQVQPVNAKVVIE